MPAAHLPWRFRAPSPEATPVLVRQIPGVKLRGGAWLDAPTNAAWLLERRLAALGSASAPVRREAPQAPLAELPFIPELRPWVPEFLLPYQRAGLLYAIPRAGTLLYHAPGAGKTLCALAWALAAPGLVIFCTRGGARGTIQREALRYTTVEPLVLDGETPMTILRRDDVFERPVLPRMIIVGYEILPAWVSELERLAPVSVVFDESHRVKSNKRWSMVSAAEDEAAAAVLEDGRRVNFAQNDNQTAAAMRLSRLAKRRLATTATPIVDRIRDLWAQLDLIEPGEWGNFATWAKWYCGAFPGAHTALDTRGRGCAQALEELRGRLAFSFHYVPHSVSHRDLPAKRRNVVRLTLDQQVAATGYAKELRAAARLGAESVLEVRLAEAAARKRRWLLQSAANDARGGAKVVVFTGRHREVEALGAALQKELSAAVQTLDDKVPSAPPVRVWALHGGHSEKERDQAIVDFVATKSHCVFAGTSQCFGESIDGFQTADVSYIAQLPFRPGDVWQIEHRFSRHGVGEYAPHPHLINYVQAQQTADDAIVDIVLEKLPAVEKVLGDGALAGMGETLSRADEKTVVKSILAQLGIPPIPSSGEGEGGSGDA